MTLQCLAYPTLAIKECLRRAAPVCTRSTLPPLGLVEVIESYVYHQPKAHPGPLQWRLVLCITHQAGVPYGEFVQMAAADYRQSKGEA